MCPATSDRKHALSVLKKFVSGCNSPRQSANIFHEAKKADGFLRFPIHFR